MVGVAASGILRILALGVGLLVLIEVIVIGLRVASLPKRLPKMDEREGLQTRYLIAMWKNLARLLQRNLPAGAPMPDDGTEETTATQIFNHALGGNESIVHQGERF